jgi:hypothetical protein
VFRRRSRKPEPVHTDDEIAGSMLEYAEIFVDGCTVDGFQIDWDGGSANKLDGICEHFLGGHPGEDDVRHMTVAMGAYLGELIVRNSGGRWTYHEEHGPVVALDDGRNCLPHNKVAKRLELGDEHGLWAFYEYAVTGEVPPGAQAG